MRAEERVFAEIVIEPENGRYAADLVFLHGLWTSSDVWQPAARGFAHRGWRCILLEAGPREADAPASFAAWVEGAAEVAGRQSAPPIVVGHDAGALVALALAERSRIAAAIAIAPLFDGPASLVPLARRLGARVRGAPLPPPSEEHAYRRVASPVATARLAGALSVEPAARIASFRGAALVPGSPKVPTLLAAQKDDAVVPPTLVEVTARGLETDFLRLPGGHWALLEEGLDPWMSELHRWIIRRIGGSILLLRGDEDLRDE